MGATPGLARSASERFLETSCKNALVRYRESTIAFFVSSMSCARSFALRSLKRIIHRNNGKITILRLVISGYDALQSPCVYTPGSDSEPK
jgi:hypothetical protein